MRILAVEFSSEKRSVAIADAAGREPAHILGAAEDVGGRSVKALTMVELALTQAGVDRAEIECIAVGLGPGSYAGIRAAISLAQGWQLARNVRLIGIGSVEALAFEAQRLGKRGNVSFAIDAQRSEYYLATYSVAENDYQVVEPLHIVSQLEVIERIGQGHWVAGPDPVPGAEMVRLHPVAAGLAQLAARSRSFAGGETLEPIYLREARFVKAASRRDPAKDGEAL